MTTLGIWDQTFNGQKSKEPSTWEKMFHPKQTVKIGYKIKRQGLSEQQCKAAIAVFGPLPEVKEQCGKYL